jgi:hypothetical protein
MIHLCVTHDQALRPAAVDAIEFHGFNVHPTPVVQVDFGRDPHLSIDSPEVITGIDRIRKLAPGQDVYIDWEYQDHYANTRVNTQSQLFIKLILAGEIRQTGNRAGIYGPVCIRANAHTAISQSSIENLKAVGRLFDFVVIPVYIATQFEPGSVEERRYMLNTLSALREIRAVLLDGVEIMLAFQFSVRPSGTTRLEMTEYEALVMGEVIAASGATPLWWYEARESGKDAIDRRMAEVDRLGGKFRMGLERHRVDRNMDVGDPQGVE